MKIIYNRFIPFKGFMAINLFGICFIRTGCTPSPENLNHEAIHSAQIKEMLYIFFYIWYLVEWLIKLMFYGRKAYVNLSFEREAYTYQSNPQYLINRKKYHWVKRILK